MDDHIRRRKLGREHGRRRSDQEYNRSYWKPTTAISRIAAIVSAWIISAIFFGLVHLPTHSWNWIQCIVVIGTARVVLSLAYVKTKNIWVAAGAHILNDWTIFTLSFMGTTLMSNSIP